MKATDSPPVFYALEASSLAGWPIEIGWAEPDPGSGLIFSESYFIRPPFDWDVRGSWDGRIAARHRIAPDNLWRAGRPVSEIARRMNQTLDGRELFSDYPFAECWLRKLFEAAGLWPKFIVRKGVHPIDLLHPFLNESTTYSKAKTKARRIAPPIHRAEAVARHWAVMWTLIAGQVRAEHQASPR
jgi:hypothetical protein